MEKIYKFVNGKICISNLDTYNRERFKKATERFLKIAINERMKENGNGNTRGDF